MLSQIIFIWITILQLSQSHIHPPPPPPIAFMHQGGRTRIVYIAAIDIEWDYAPNGNLYNNDPRANDFIQQGPNRIGSVYDKVVFRMYTDGSFLKPLPVQPWQGIVGPIFRAEVGDIIIVKFANLAFKCNVSLAVHAHGVLYRKNSEGARYQDGTRGRYKMDDAVPPGHTYTYRWDALDTFAPTADDDNCLAWAYHSHALSPRDIDTGLVGLFLVCKRGVLDDYGNRHDIDREYVIYMDTTDEQNSHCFKTNAYRCGDVAACQQLAGSGDENFLTSNNMRHINGYVYANLPGLHAKVGEKVVWHFFSLNNGIQSAHINGQTFIYKKHRLGSLNFQPSYFRTGIMIAKHPGLWLMQSRIVDWYLSGMMAFVHIRPSYNYLSRYYRQHQYPGPGPGPRQWPILLPPIMRGPIRQMYGNHPEMIQPMNRNQLRTYYIAIEKGIWNFVPSGKDLYNGGDIDDVNKTSATFYTRTTNRIGPRYIKARYVEYTDSTFTVKKTRSTREAHLGILGPVIRAEVGDVLEIVLKNNADRDYSIWVQGLTYPKSEEGFVINDPFTHQVTGKYARPGEIITYRYEVSKEVSPTRDDPACLSYSYQSAVDSVKDIFSGLVGPLLICKPGQMFNRYTQMRDHWSQQEREFFLIFMVHDENQSHYLDENIRTFTTNPRTVDKTDEAFDFSNFKFTINGRAYGNLEGLDMCIGDEVTWYIFGLGAFRDTHGVNFQGQTIEVLGNRVEGKVINPGIGITAHSTPDSIGRWSLQCRTNNHFNWGMVSLEDVFSCGARPSKYWRRRPHPVRRYYIAAVEVDWDYAPVKNDVVTGLPLTNPSQPGYKFVRNDGGNFIGTVYKKAVYREFIDDTFTKQVPRGPHMEHLGILGPYIKANVGDRVEVVFKNMASRNYSLHAQGMFYNKGNEGAKYQDGSRYTADDSVGPGNMYVYKWSVPPRSGPGENDPNCISWIYHSSVDSSKDMYTGLIGPMVVCRHGVLDRFGHRTDGITKEFAVMFVIFEENESYYYEENAARFAPNRANIEDEDFLLSNTKYSINGLIYGNLKGLNIHLGETVAWHVMSVGGSLGVHPIHFHGQTFIHRTDKVHRKDVIEVFPSTTETVEMFTENPGSWLFHCHVSLHVTSGMEAVYNIIQM